MNFTELSKSLSQRLDWYVKFLTLTRNFVEQARRSPESAVEDLDYFLNNRQSLLGIIASHEKKITLYLESTKLIDGEGKEVGPQILKLTQDTNALIRESIRLDEELDRILERQRVASLAKIKALRNGQKVISSYRQEGLEAEHLDVHL